MELKYEGRDLEAMSFAQNYHTWILETFAPFMGDRVAEVGAGAGNISSMLLAAPLKELVAVEPSEGMFRLLSERIGNDERVVRKRGVFAEVCGEYAGHFDSVLYINVLEHIKDDATELRHAGTALKKGGHVCIFVPALSWLYSEFDASIGHYRRYHKPELHKLMEDAGFEVIQLRYFDVAGVLPWFLFLKLLRKRLDPKNTERYDTYVIPYLKMLETRITVPFGKNLIAVGRKLA